MSTPGPRSLDREDRIAGPAPRGRAVALAKTSDQEDVVRQVDNYRTMLIQGWPNPPLDGAVDR